MKQEELRLNPLEPGQIVLRLGQPQEAGYRIRATKIIAREKHCRKAATKKDERVMALL